MYREKGGWKNTKRNEVWESLRISSCLTADWDCEDLWRSLAGRRRYGWHWVEGAATTSDRGTCQPEVRWSGSRIKSYWERRREGGTWQQNLCQWKSALRLWLVFYRLGQMESDAGNAFESKDKRYLKGEWKERKGDRRRTSKLTAMLAISIRERRRRRWSWSGCCSSPCTTWPFREGAHAHKEKCGEFDSYK